MSMGGVEPEWDYTHAASREPRHPVVQGDLSTRRDRLYREKAHRLAERVVVAPKGLGVDDVAVLRGCGVRW
jgi:hypothetical protein